MRITNVPGTTRSTGLRPPEPSAARWSVLPLLLIMATSPHASAQTGAGRILFQSERDGEGGLFGMDADGSNQTRLTSGNDGRHVWSPDACKIVFRRGLTDIYVMDADGSNQTLVVRTGGDDPQGDFRSYFSADGSRILFHARGMGSQYKDLFVVNVDGSDLVNLTNNTQPDYGPSWSPDGSKILFESSREPSGIYVMNAEGTAVRRLAAGRAPTWSPDGSKIAFVTAAGDHSDIVVMNADGTEVTVLTDGSGFVYRHSWSPDGSLIAFETISESDGDVLLELMNADGTNRTKLADQVMFVLSGEAPVSWSPDGSTVVFTRMPVPLSEMASEMAKGGLSLDIYAVDADGSDLTRLTTGGMNMLPAWSPTARCEKGS